MGAKMFDDKTGPDGSFLSMEHFDQLLSQVSSYVHTMLFYFQGEPLLHPLLSEMIAKAHKEGLYTIVSTNAQALTPLLAHRLAESGLSRIIVSIDGMGETSYSAYRIGGSLHQALEGLAYLRHAKNELGAKMHIELQSLRLRTNEHEWKTMQRQYRAMGADSLSIKSAQFYDYEHGNALMPTNERYSRYQRMKDGTYRLKHPHTHVCHRLWTGAVVTVTGEFLPCCMDKGSQYSYGNVWTETVEQVYHSHKADAFRQHLIATHFRHRLCKNCSI